MSPQSRWLLPEPAFLFAFLSRQRSLWLFMRKKGSISTFCVKGDRLLLLYHWRTVPCISCGVQQEAFWEYHGGKVLMCHQPDILLSVWENELTCSFFLYIKKLQMESWEVIWGPDCIRHICPFMIRTCCSGTGQIMCNVSRETVRLRWAFLPRQAHCALVTCFCPFLSAWHMFVCVWNENSMHQWTQRIKDVVFLFPKSKLLRMPAPCLSCCCRSFEKQQKRHIQVMAFSCYDWQQVWHMGSLVTMVTGSCTWLACKFTGNANAKELRKTKQTNKKHLD